MVFPVAGKRCHTDVRYFRSSDWPSSFKRAKYGGMEGRYSNSSANLHPSCPGLPRRFGKTILFALCSPFSLEITELPFEDTKVSFTVSQV